MMGINLKKNLWVFGVNWRLQTLELCALACTRLQAPWSRSGGIVAMTHRRLSNRRAALGYVR